MTEYEIPVRLVSGANLREHWAIKSKRNRLQRDHSRIATIAALRGGIFQPPLTITIERIGKRRLDSDNLAISAKAVRDGIADALGIDDGDPRLDWQYRQSVGRDYTVRVTIRGT
jgi:crossover junction endodeoxyribonuclease RusA